MYVLSYVGYMVLFGMRKLFSLTKSQIQIELECVCGFSARALYCVAPALTCPSASARSAVPLSSLGAIDTAHLFAYAGGGLISGMVVDRMGPVELLSGSIIGSAVICALFATCSDLKQLETLWFACGLFQSVGWPASMKVSSPAAVFATHPTPYDLQNEH